MFRKSIAIDRGSSIAIWRLTSGNSTRTIAEARSTRQSLVIEISNQFTKTIFSLTNQFILFPVMRDKVAEAVHAFNVREDCKIPVVFGTIDGVHIRTLAPAHKNKADYFNRKQWFTFNTQGVVGADLILYFGSTSFPGSIHDSRSFRNCFIYNKIKEIVLCQRPLAVINRTCLQPVIFGDSAYGLTE